MKFKNNQPILQLKDIHVVYDDIKALKGVDFNLFRGEIHALVGEHRAGKSTLVKILSGAVRKNKGEIFLRNQKFEYFTPLSAIKVNSGAKFPSSTNSITASMIVNITNTSLIVLRLLIF